MWIAACSSAPGGPAEGSSSRSPREQQTESEISPSSTTLMASLAVDAAGIADVAFGGSTSSVLDLLTRRLGPPQQDTGWTSDRCIAPERERRLRWDALTVILRDDPAQAGSAVLSGWLLQRSDGVIPDNLVVEPDVTFATGWAELNGRGALWHQEPPIWELDGLIGTLSASAADPAATVTAIGGGSSGLLGC